MYCMVYIVYHSPPNTCCSDVRFSSDKISSIFIFTQTYMIVLQIVTKQQFRFVYMYVCICMYVCLSLYVHVCMYVLVSLCVMK